MIVMKMKTRLATRVKQVFESAPPKKTVPNYLVYYDGGLTSLAALREACEMASKPTRVVAVYLDQVPEEQMIDGNAAVNDMRAKAVLAGAIANARIHDVEIETLSIPCHVKGPALVSLAAEQGSSILFIGVDDHELNEHLNPFADYVLSLAPCKVVLVGVCGLPKESA